MTSFMRLFYGLTRDLAHINKTRTNVLSKSLTFEMNNLLTDFYNENWHINWKKQMVIKDNTYYKSNMYLIDNLELSMINIPKSISFCHTNIGHSSFIVLSGGTDKYYINNNFEMYNNFNVGNVGNIYDNETYTIKSHEDTLLMNITIYKSMEECLDARRVDYYVDNFDI